MSVVKSLGIISLRDINSEPQMKDKVERYSVDRMAEV